MITERPTETNPNGTPEFLVDAGGYLTALTRRELSGQLNYTERNLIEKWFQTVTMRIDRFHSFWLGRFRHHYNHDRPNQALDGRTPPEEVLNQTVPEDGICLRGGENEGRPLQDIHTTGVRKRWSAVGSPFERS